MKNKEKHDKQEKQDKKKKNKYNNNDLVFGKEPSQHLIHETIAKHQLQHL